MQKHAAELLRVKPTTLNEMIKRHGIRSRASRGGAGTPQRVRAGHPVRSDQGAGAAKSVPFVSDLVEAFNKGLSRVE